MPDEMIASETTSEIADALSVPFSLFFALALAMTIAMRLESSRSQLGSRPSGQVRRWGSKGRGQAGGMTVKRPRR